MPNKLGLSTPEMPDIGPGSTGFPSNVRNDLRTIAETAERRGTAFPTDPAMLSGGDKFYNTAEQVTYEYHADSATWVPLAQSTGADISADLTAHKTSNPVTHADLSIPGSKLKDGQVTAAKLATDAATDAAIGNRTINANILPIDTNLLTPLLGGIARLICDIKGVTAANWKATPALSLLQARQHVDAASPHTGHETPTGAQTKVNAHNTAQGAHGLYSGPGAPTIGAAPGSVWRDTSGGFLWEARASGWARVGMSIKSIQRVAMALPSGNASGTITISGVDTTKAVLAHMGVSAGGTGGNQDSSTMVTVGMQLISATQIQVSRGNTGSALTVFAQVTEWE